MEIHRWHLCVIFICVIIIKYTEAKTFSINEAIAAESLKKRPEVLETRQHKVTENTASRYTSKKSISPTLKSKVRELRKQENTYPGTQRISPLIYRKTFQINSPLKPKKLKHLKPLRNKRKNQSVKREISGNDKLKQKYIPLLKSISMLFDNLLNTDTSESFEVKTKKYKRNQYYPSTDERSREECSCKTDFKTTESRSQEKATTLLPPLATEISAVTEVTTAETATAATDYSTTPDIRTLRPNKNIPVLFPRNTVSPGRDNNGVSEGSGASYNRNAERHIAGSYGNSQHNTRCAENESDTESNEKIPCSTSRDDASSDRSAGRVLGDRDDSRNSEIRTTEDESTISEDKTAVDDFRRENKFQIRRNKTKSSETISESIRRLRGFVPKPEVGDLRESIQSEEIREESNVSDALYNAGDKRFVGGSSSSTAENKKVRKRNETVRSYKIQPKPKSPVVMIFDGYSVTRDKNGENKLAEKAISIHS